MPLTTRSGPVIRRGSFPFPVAVVCWIDLLGYGGMIAEAGFNPLHPKASEALNRLQRFHRIVSDHSAQRFPTLVMNDGAVAYRDLSLRHSSVTYDFFSRAWRLFSDINRVEQVNGLPGARLVIACGFRVHRRHTGIDAKSGHLKSLMERYHNGKLNAEEAIREAASSRRLFDIVPELQANFAFTKAYLAESGGSRGGLAGSNFFVDLTIFEEPPPPWVMLGERIMWSNQRLNMNGIFAPVLDLPPSKHAAGGPKGVRNGLQIAQLLTNDPDVLNIIRAARLR
jgi:hypothetical protein